MLRGIFARTRSPRLAPRGAGPFVSVIGHVVPGGKNRSGALSVAGLREFLGGLAGGGYTVRSIDDLSQELLRGGRGRLRNRTLALAVEGGCSCQREFVIPLLRAMSLPHTLFVKPGHLGRGDAMSREDVRLLVREGTTVGGLWSGGDRLEGMGTMEAAWHLEMLAHEIGSLGLPPAAAGGPWLSLVSDVGGERIMTLARAAGFAGILDAHRVPGPWHLPRRPVSNSPSGLGSRKTGPAFQGVCAARR